MKRLSPRAAFVLAFLLGWVGGCQCGGTGFEKERYACTTDRDCLEGWTCVDGFCAEGTGGSGGGSGGDAGCTAEPEICGNAIDENCNGVLDDGCPCTGASRPCYDDGLDSPTLRQPWDGGAGCSAGTQACVGGVWAAQCVGQHKPQLEFCDGKDTDCDGLPDPINCPCQQGRSCYQGIPDTVNANPAGKSTCRTGLWDCSVAPGTCVGQVLPAAREVCDGFDDDCNGLVDDLADTDPCGPGLCSSIFKTCVNGTQVACDLTLAPGYSATEICGDGIDNNCNNQVEEGCTCALDAGISCWTGSSSQCPTDGGACKGICARGTQRCGTLADGGIGYGSCAGSVQAQLENCSNGLDDDCNGLTDCADSSCSGRSCNATGKICTGGSCQCVLDGGTVQANETICNDGKDNDCDGLIDCAETACAGQSCGLGKVCTGGQCTTVDAGSGPETQCSDGIDNDGNGKTDCADNNCDGRTCGANGRVCQSLTCTCLGGGTPQAVETTCNDGRDNDCDGLVDCADPNCLADGGSGSCVSETNCSDGLDNDNDGMADCLDSDCNHKKCSATAGSVCCGNACINVSNDPNNCGGCGVVCSSGICSPVTSSGHTSGECTCTTGSNCPNQQACNNGACDCSDNDSKCATGRCNQITGADYCYYSPGGN